MLMDMTPDPYNILKMMSGKLIYLLAQVNVFHPESII
jgi:hypothetical protein